MSWLDEIDLRPQSRHARKLLYLHEYKDRHGRMRRYFRRVGMREIPLKGPAGSLEFMENYRAALAATPEPLIRKRPKWRRQMAGHLGHRRKQP